MNDLEFTQGMYIRLSGNETVNSDIRGVNLQMKRCLLTKLANKPLKSVYLIYSIYSNYVATSDKGVLLRVDYDIEIY